MLQQQSPGAGEELKTEELKKEASQEAMKIVAKKSTCV